MLPKFPFESILNWYEKNGRTHLPWREYNYNIKTLTYRVWLAETMLQQTQVERVRVYFKNILETFPTVEDLARCSYEDFFPYYKGLGYYSRARNMLKASERVVSDFGGIFPSETEKLRTLPGVGPYTTEAIRAFAYDIPTLSFDTNLEKIFTRYYYGTKQKKLTKEEKIQIVTDFVDSGYSSRDINNALMDFGATVSLNAVSGVDWNNYPLTNSKFYLTRGSLEPITVKKKSSFPSKEAYVICILHENHKKYFSQESNFSPFLIGKNTGNPRLMIQEYFHKKYGLELSVRPPEVKSYNSLEIPYLVCYAQIQSGAHNFEVFEGLKVRGCEESLVEEMELGENLSLF